MLCWILVGILKLGLVKTLELKCYGEADVWLIFWSWCLVEILKMKFDQYLCLTLWYELNPRVRCAFGNVSYCHLQSFLPQYGAQGCPDWRWCENQGFFIIVCWLSDTGGMISISFSTWGLNPSGESNSEITRTGRHGLWRAGLPLGPENYMDN